MPKDKHRSKQEILAALRDLMLHKGMPPTIEELRSALGVGSTRTVLRYLESLESDGEIERWSGARGIRLLRSHGQGGLQTREIPIVGEASAGPLMLAEENIEATVRVPVNFASPAKADFFLLRVRGDSMNLAQTEGGSIESGDLVLVRRQPTALAREIVVALVDGEATIKRLVPGPGYVVLKPESSNPRNQPILVDHDFRILGVVMRVVKNGSELFNLRSDGQ